MITKNRIPDGSSKFVYYLPLLLVLLLATLLRVFGIDQQSLWYDELTTWKRAVIPLGEMFADLFAVRTHTPIYFLLMRGWATIGESAFVLRYFSTLWGILGVAIIYKLGALVGGRRVGLIASILLAISPFHIWYSQESRMYAMLATLALIANLCLLILMRRERRLLWMAYILALAAVLYTHFLAFLLPVAHYAYLSVHYRRLRAFLLKWLAATSAAVALFAVWAGAILLSGGFKEARFGAWIAPARLFEPLRTLLSLSIGPSIDPTSLVPYLVLVLFLIFLVYGFIRFGRRLPSSASAQRVRETLDYRLLLFWCGIPILMLYLISLDWPIPQKRSVYVDRYLIMSLPALLLAVAWGLSAMSRQEGRRWIRSAALIVVALTSVATLFNYYSDQSYWREDWRDSLAELASSSHEGDVVLGRPDHVLPLEYYGPEGLLLYELPAAVTDEELLPAFEEEMLNRVSIAAAVSDRAWLVTLFYNNDAHGFPGSRNLSMERLPATSLQMLWMDTHYTAVREIEQTGLRLTLYDLTTNLNQRLSWDMYQP